MKKLLVIIPIIIITFISIYIININKQKNEKLKVVTTTTMLADLVNVIGGTKVEVFGLMGPGIDPHLYNASAKDVTKMRNANIVVYNGIHLEGKMSEVFEQLKNKDIFCAENYIDKNDLLMNKEQNVYDPHIWFDVSLWKKVAIGLANYLGKMDQENEKYYQENLEEYVKELENLETHIKTRINELSDDQKVLITAHDAFGYFGKAYGFEVKGLQGISTASEAGTKDVSELADFISTNKIKAIFVESSVPTRTIEALQSAVQARGFSVKIGGQLYSDSLGDANTGHETYLKTVKSNIDTIVESLK